MALAHLLATQVSLWLINFETTLSPCGYHKAHDNDHSGSHATTQRISKRIYTSGSQNQNQTSMRGTTIAPEMSVEKQSIIPSNVTDLLTPIIHHYQLLIVSILFTMMLTNNQSKYHQKSILKQARLMDGETIRSFLTSKTRAVKGFFVGLLVLAAGFIVLVLGDEMLTICTHTGIQVATSHSFTRITNSNDVSIHLTIGSCWNRSNHRTVDSCTRSEQLSP